MNLENLLREKKPTIVKRWVDLIIDSYPSDARRFLKKEKDPFSNPVGGTILQELGNFYDALTKGGDRESLCAPLESIIKLRAVQDFKPSEAVSFVMGLKQLVKEELGGHPSTAGSSGEFQDFEKRVDDAVLLAFDLYSKCRKKIYDLRVKEVKRQVSRLLVRANLVCEIPEIEPDL